MALAAAARRIGAELRQFGEFRYLHPPALVIAGLEAEDMELRCRHLLADTQNVTNGEFYSLSANWRSHSRHGNGRPFTSACG